MRETKKTRIFHACGDPNQVYNRSCHTHIHTMFYNHQYEFHIYFFQFRQLSMTSNLFIGVEWNPIIIRNKWKSKDDSINGCIAIFFSNEEVILRQFNGTRCDINLIFALWRTNCDKNEGIRKYPSKLKKTSIHLELKYGRISMFVEENTLHELISLPKLLNHMLNLYLLVQSLNFKHRNGDIWVDRQKKSIFQSNSVKTKISCW